MNYLKVLVFCLLCVFASATKASIEGIWWNPQQSGLGWSFRVEGDLLFGLFFGYEDPGARPTFRSVIGNATYTRLSNGNVRVTYTGDTFRTENFNVSTRTGPFTGIYENGVFSINAAGFQQSLVPFDFNYANGLSKIIGFWAVANLPLTGIGESQTVLFSRFTSIISGRTVRTYALSSGLSGFLIFDRGQYVAVNSSFFTGTVEAYVFPEIPLSYGPLVGDQTDNFLVGSGCLFDTALFRCVNTPRDILAKSITNSEGETIFFLGSFGALPEAGLDKNLPSAEKAVEIGEAVWREYLQAKSSGLKSATAPSRRGFFNPDMP